MAVAPTAERWRPRFPAEFARTAIPLLAVIIGLSLYTNSRNGSFLTSTNIQNVIEQSAALGILAIGQSFLLVGGQLDLSVGSLVSFTGVVAAHSYTQGMNEWLILVVLLAIGAGTGLFWGLIVTYLKVPPFILTLGGLSVFSSLALVIAHNRPISVVNAFNSLGFGHWLGLQAPVTLYIALLIVAIGLLHFTRFGRQVYALGSSEQVAFLAGLPVNRIKVSIFVLNGLLAGVAGLVQMARLAAGDPSSGSGLELSCVAACVLGGASLAGGRGTILGSLLGTIVFGVINSSLVFLNVASAWQNTVSGGVLIFAVAVTALGELRRDRKSGTESSLGQVLGRLLLSRSAPPPASGAVEGEGSPEPMAPVAAGGRPSGTDTPNL